MFSEIFFTFLVTSTLGFCALSLRMCYKSKCTHVRFCGFELDRDTEAEGKIDILTPGGETKEDVL
jgi:hypothetical protein